MKFLEGGVVVAAIAGAFAAVAHASTPALRVTPSSVHRGGTVTFTGAGCRRGETVFLISGLFPGHAYGGEGRSRLSRDAAVISFVRFASDAQHHVADTRSLRVAVAGISGSRLTSAFSE
jgi:hypothetical protein